MADAYITADSELTHIDVVSFKVGDKTLASSELESIVQIIHTEPYLYRIVLVHPEQFEEEGVVSIELSGETTDPASVSGSVRFALVQKQQVDDIFKLY